MTSNSSSPARPPNPVSALSSAAVAASLLLISPGLRAAQPPASSQPVRTVVADPAALPGDTPMPSFDFQLKKDLGPSAGTHAQPQPAVASTGLTLGLALEAAQAAIDTCQADGYRIGVAVTDEAGQLLVGLAADGSGAGRIYVAVRKDLTAATFKMSTLALRSKLIAQPALLAQVKPNMSVFSGAVPLMAGDRVLGAIASSGSTGNEDDKCARSGAQKIESRLK